MLKPLEDKVLLKPVKEETVTSSGLVLAGGSEKPQEAIVVAVGPGIVLQNGEKVVPDVKVGDKVVFSKYGGTEVEHEGVEYLLVAYRDIFAVLESND